MYCIIFAEVKKLEVAYNEINIEKYNQISTYHDIREQLDRLSNDFRSYLTKPEYLLPFLQPGRLIKVRLIQDEVIIKIYLSTYLLLTSSSFVCIFKR